MSFGREEFFRQRASCSSGQSSVPIRRVTVLGQSRGKTSRTSCHRPWWLSRSVSRDWGACSYLPVPSFWQLSRQRGVGKRGAGTQAGGSGAAGRSSEAGQQALSTRTRSETKGARQRAAQSLGYRDFRAGRGHLEDTSQGNPFFLQLGHQSQQREESCPGLHGMLMTPRGGEAPWSPGGQLCPRYHTMLLPSLSHPLPPSKWSR